MCIYGILCRDSVSEGHTDSTFRVKMRLHGVNFRVYLNEVNAQFCAEGIIYKLPTEMSYLIWM